MFQSENKHEKLMIDKYKDILQMALLISVTAHKSEKGEKERDSL